MSCMVSRLLTDLTRSADRRIAVTGPERLERPPTRPTPVWSLANVPRLTNRAYSMHVHPQGISHFHTHTHLAYASARPWNLGIHRLLILLTLGNNRRSCGQKS